MFREVKFITSTLWLGSGFGALLLAAVFALLPNSAHAQCAAGWNVGGKWFMNQGGTPVSMDLVQTGGLVKGTARYFTDFGRIKDKSTEVYGDVEGTVKNDDFNVHIYWREPLNGLSSVYSGKISPQGRIDGEGYGTEKPSKTFGWFSSVQMKCPTPPRVIKSTGRAKVDPPPPPISSPKITPTTPEPEAQPAATEPATPMVRASSHSALIRTPRTEGKTTLTWDGGPSHRAAELWLKVDDEDETMVIASAKGSLQVSIVAGKVYLYMLKEAGKTLATDTVQFRQGGQVRPIAPAAVADEAAPPEATAPQISATPTDAAFVPGKIAHTVIRWDGGTDHPHAQLWVKVDDQEEKFVIEQGKGSRLMVVEPGKSYLYMLRDSGTRLATVTVKFH